MSFGNWLLFTSVFAPDPTVHERVHISGLRPAHAELLWSAPRAAGSQTLRLQHPGGGSGHTPGARAGPEHNHDGGTDQGAQPAAGLGGCWWGFPVAEAATKFYVTLWTQVGRQFYGF